MDKFKDMDNAALAALSTEKRAALAELLGLERPTIEQVEQAEALAAEVIEIETESTERDTAATKAGEKFAELQKRFNKDGTDAGVGDSATGNQGTLNPEGGEETATKEQREAAEHEETVQESPGENVAPGNIAPDEDPEGTNAPKGEGKGGTGRSSKSALARLAAQTTRPAAPAAQQRKPIAITAAADVPQFANGQTLEGLEQVAKAVINRARGFSPPSGDGTSVSLQQFGTAMFNLEFEDDLIVDRMEDAQEVMKRAADEHRLPGGSLVAAGGWCAPSETVYDLDQDATTEGMLSLPEIAVRRGGIRYAQSPVFADFYANPGFIQTEAQAIAGTTKPCVEVPCPSFTEVRLDAEGICIKVPILTNAAYPEVVSNFISGTLIAHQHWINANVIGRLVTFAGAARVLPGVGSTVNDTMGGLELLADQNRQTYRLSMNLSMEVVVPFWVKGALRSDLAARTGQLTPVTDQQIAAHFSARRLNVQYVYDWQPLPTVDVGGTAGTDESLTYPTTFNALMYPAGTFVKGTSDVINLNTVYDAASLAVNTYTGLFAEQGLLVAKMKNKADLVTLPVCSAGRTGAHDLTCNAANWA